MELFPVVRRVSRRHAQITEKSGAYFFEGLSPQNPTFLNVEMLESGQVRPIRVGDEIELGYSGIKLQLIRRSDLVLTARKE